MALPDWLKKLATYGSVLRSFDANGNERLSSKGESIGLVVDQGAALTCAVLDSNGNIKTTATTSNNREAHNVPAPTGSASADAAELTAVQAGDVVVRSFTTNDVDGVTVDAKGGVGFAGVYVTLSSTDIGSATAATRLTGRNDDNDSLRIFCRAGEKTFIPFPGLQYVYIVAMDVDGSEQNHINLYPV